MRETQCDSWQGFKSLIAAFAKMPRAVRDLYIFRGQADADWKLETTLDRAFSHLGVAARQRKLARLLQSFAEELLGIEGHFEGLVTDRLEFLGRHHGLPTTVLDWTRSPYIAAYFAFESPVAPPDEHVAIWAFDKRSLAGLPEGNQVLIDDTQLIVQNPRAIEQRGVFMRIPIGASAEMLLSRGLRRFIIPYRERRVALNDLDEMLINAKMLFRDRDSAARTALIRESLAEDSA